MRTKSILLVLALSLLTLSACSKAEGQLKVGALAPDFSLETIAGETIVLSELLQDKKVVLDFWATWCPYCVKAIPELEAFYGENKDKVAVIGVDIGESKAKVQSFAQKKNISYPIALDLDSKVAELYKVRGVPTVVAIDTTGEILYYGHSIEEMAERVDF